MNGSIKNTKLADTDIQRQYIKKVIELDEERRRLTAELIVSDDLQSSRDIYRRIQNITDSLASNAIILGGMLSLYIEETDTDE